MIIFFCFLGITLIGNIYTQAPNDEEDLYSKASMALLTQHNRESLPEDNFLIETNTDHIKITCLPHTDLRDIHSSRLEDKELLEIQNCNIQQNTKLKNLFLVRSLEFFKSDTVVLSKNINLMKLDSLHIEKSRKVVIKSDFFESQPNLSDLIIENVYMLKYEEALILEKSTISPSASTSNKINKLYLTDIAIIYDNFLDKFRNLRSLTYNKNSFKLLTKRPFQWLTQLTDLNLNENYKMKLDNDLFTGLDNLRNLKISQNSLTSLGNKVFNNLNILYELDLNFNEIENITSDNFQGLYELEILHFTLNNLYSLANAPFKALKNLRFLDLGYNAITELASDSFKGLHKLKGLLLNNNRLTSIENTPFSELEELFSLNLKFNQITTIAADSFEGLKQLQILYLNDNHLTSFEENLFVGLKKINELRIYNNDFEKPDINWFYGLKDEACIYFHVPDSCVQYSDMWKKGFLPKALREIWKR